MKKTSTDIGLWKSFYLCVTGNGPVHSKTTRSASAGLTVMTASVIFTAM